MSSIHISRSSTKETLNRPKLLLQGLDSLYVAYYLDMVTGRLDWEDLAFQKERLQRTRNEKFAEIELGSERFALRPYGQNPYAYVLSNKAFQVAIGEHIKPNCYVQFLSEALWQFGVNGVLERFDEWCRSLRFVATRPESVSRADWAFDYDWPTVEFAPEHFVSRASKNATWREHQYLQTVTFGSGDTVIRIYDKVAEIGQKSGKVWFFELWGQQENVWRTEFQLRRERLRLAGINTTQDLKHFQNDLLRELATNHTTLRRPNGDTNRSRWPLHPYWQALQADIATLPQTGLVQAIDPCMPLDWRLHQQIKSLYGNLKGIGAVLGLLEGTESPLALDNVLEALPEVLEEHHDAGEWSRALADRMQGYELGKW